MINHWLEILSDMIQGSFWLAPLLAVFAGILTSVTPCSLSSIPLVIGYVGGGSDGDTARSFRLSLTFALGMAVTFTGLGVAAALLGRLMSTTGSWWYVALGVLMVLMGLQVLEIYNFIPSTYLQNRNSKTGYIGAFITGILGGVFSSPCATPVLVVLLSIVAKSGNIAWGVLLLLLYSAGNTALVVIAGTWVGFVSKISTSGKYGKFSIGLKYFMGIGVLLIGFYMFYLGF